MICLVNAVNQFKRQESGYSDTRGSEGPSERFVGDGDGPVLRGGTGESVVNEALMEEACGFVGVRFMLDGGEEQRVERRMLLLDDAGDLAVAPDVPTASEPGDEHEKAPPKHRQAVDVPRHMIAVDRSNQKAPPHKNTDGKDSS